jgi:hypothetical protein
MRPSEPPKWSSASKWNELRENAPTEFHDFSLAGLLSLSKKASRFSMNSLVAGRAASDKVFLYVIAKMASPFHVVNL